MNLNLDDLSLSELRELRGRIDRAIASFEDRKRREALTRLEEKARELGYSLADLTGAGRKRRANAPRAAKYANPANPSETWSGRGRRPAWVNEALAAGKGLDDLTV
ncbi:H-NS family nucleoid-associated regulatory protein [Paracoccus sp. p4-l81]|uniref:H-NS histone family protein n=1 Tax=unclassified Paracoccus (in: a-proteobacteria) TaxID=2688777 RepID=UPI0035B6FC03